MNAQMDYQDRDRAAGAIGFGTLLIGVGLFVLLGNLGVIGLLSWRLLWPAALLGYGLVRIVVPRREGSPAGAMWVATVGALWLMDATALVAWRQSWPLFVILVGLTLMFRALGWLPARPPCARVRS